MKLKNLSFAISAATIMAFGSLFSPAYSAGKDITIVIAEEPDIVDPCEATRSVVGKIVKQNVTETLTEINPADGSVTPRLATSWKQTDNLTWEFNIRKGIKFHDGEDLNAKAVVTLGKDMTFRDYAQGSVGPFFFVISIFFRWVCCVRFCILTSISWTLLLPTLSTQSLPGTFRMRGIGQGQTIHLSI